MSVKLNKIIYVLAWIAFGLSFATLIKAIVSNPLSSDSFLHLAIGKYIAYFQHIPSHFDISYKTADVSLSWMSYSWLADILLYGSVATDLAHMSILIPILSWFACLTLLIILFQELKFSILSQVTILSVVQFILQIYWRVHPLLFIAPLLLLSLIVFVRFSRRRSQDNFFLPLIGVIWANLYGGYIFIFATVLVSFFAWYVVTHRQRSVRKIASITITVILTLLTTLINPFTWHIYEKMYTFLGILQLKRAFVNESNLLSLVNQSFLLENVSTIPYAIHAFLLIVIFLSIPILLIQKRFDFFKNYSISLITAPLLIYGFIFVRFIPITILGATILLCGLFDYAQSKLRQFNIYLFLLLAITIPLLIYQLFFPLKLLTIHPPTKQIELIQKYALPGNIMTTSEYTGYTKYMLPNKLNLDLLDEVYDDAETLNVLLQSGTITKDTLKQLLDAKHIGTVLASKENGNFSRSIQIALNDEWALIYMDSNGVLFVRRNKVSSEFLRKYEMKYLSLASTLGVDQKHITEATVELEYALSLYPNNNLYRGQLATLYRIQKRPQKAAALLYAIPQNQWDYKLYTEMGRTQASMGNCTLAESFLQGALTDRTETNYSQAVLDLALVYVGCFQDKDRARHYFERYLSFTIPHTEKEKARKLADDFGIHLE